jgi:hypothetical protein
MTDLMLDEPNDYKIFCSWMIQLLMSYSKLLPLLSLKEILMCEKMSLSAFIHYARLFGQWQFFCLFVFSAPAPQGATAFSFTRFLDHTQRQTTVSRALLDE